MRNFTRTSPSYIVDARTLGSQKVCLIALTDVEPARRLPGIPIFNRSKSVICILQGFVSSSAIPPIKLVRTTGPHPYKLADGVHRFYCSLAAGFTHIPAINKGYDREPETINDEAFC